MASGPAEPSPSTDSAGSATEFDISCSCGQRHNGSRRRRHQQIICKGCGTPLFVLPLDAYPPPESLGGKGKKGKKQRSRGSRASAGAGQAKDAVNRLAERTGEKAGAIVRGFGRAFRWTFTPVKLGIYAVVMAVAGTGLFLSNQQAVARAETNIVSEADLGYAALNAGEYAEAHEHLSIAADAVRVLGREDEESRRIVQAARETGALAGLSTVSILELVQRVDKNGVDSSGRWQATERLSVQGQWLALDATVEKRGDKLAVSLPVPIGDRDDVFIRVDSAAFDEVPFADGQATLTFAGQIESIERVSSAWNVVMDPDSLFLWESPGLYTKLGFSIDPVWNTLESVTQRLEQQRLWQGGQPLPGDDGMQSDADAGEESDVAGGGDE